MLYFDDRTGRGGADAAARALMGARERQGHGFPALADYEAKRRTEQLLSKTVTK